MPVLAPLGDLVGINKEAMVMAYQFGNGLTNLVSLPAVYCWLGCLLRALGLVSG
jgi:uncharacterized ion transporter superfamily protein YfcC